MPLGLETGERKLLAICGAVLLLLVVATAILSPPDEYAGSKIPSTYSSTSDGAEAAYLLLEQLRYPVSRWEQSPTELPSPAEGALLILANPVQGPDRDEREAVDAFVRNGGRVLFIGESVSIFFPDADVSLLPPDPKWSDYSPYVPSRISRNAQKITIQPEATFGALNQRAVVLYGDPDQPLVVAWQYGKGEILWWGGATPLTNAGITSNDNLRFFLNCVANPAGTTISDDYHIYWDEYFHGERTSLWAYASHTSITWALVQIGLIAAAVVFTFSRRSGPIYKPAYVSRLSPLEYVDTLGGLYQHAKAGAAPVAVSLQRLRYLLTRQLSLPSDTADAELAHAAEERLGWKNFESEQLLAHAGAATRAEKLPSKEALDLVQKLEAYAARLELRRANANAKETK
jgi:hypothetical protein